MFSQILTTIAVCTALLVPSYTIAAPDVSDKVVFANLDRYPAQLQLGKTRKEIAPKKASVLKPKKYPVTIKFWSGNTKAGWKTFTVSEAGMYGMNFKRGNWVVAELKRGKTEATAKKPAPAAVSKSRVSRASAVQTPARRGPINADRRRWHPLARAAWFAGSIYKFARDERDRSLVRRLIREGRKEDWREVKDWLKGYDKIGDDAKAELYRSMDELESLSDADWKEIETADEKDWELAKSDIGDLFSEKEWTDFEKEFEDIDSSDFWEEDAEVDLADIDLEDNVDFGDDIELADDYDVGDLDIDADTYDLDDYDDYDGYDGDWGGDDLGDDFDDGDFFGDDDFGDFDDGFDDFDF